MDEVFLLCLFDLMNYSEIPKFVLVNLKYFDVLFESYFSISHIIYRVCLNYILINLYFLYIIIGSGHFVDIRFIKQIFLVIIHQYDFAFLLYYLSFYLSDFEH